MKAIAFLATVKDGKIEIPENHLEGLPEQVSIVMLVEGDSNSTYVPRPKRNFGSDDQGGFRPRRDGEERPFRRSFENREDRPFRKSFDNDREERPFRNSFENDEKPGRRSFGDRSDFKKSGSAPFGRERKKFRD